MPTIRLALTLLAVVVLGACSSQDARPDVVRQDVAIAKDHPLPAEQTLSHDLTRDKSTTAPDAPPLTNYKVAAIQYASGAYSQVAGCSNDAEAIISFVKEAKKNGAQLVIAPEYALGAIGNTGELAPSVGDDPAQDSRWKVGTVIKTFATLAHDEGVSIVLNLWTQDGGKSYNTSLAFGANGKVIARHYKFQLYGESCTPGTSIDTSFFDTPAGRAGMLICADVQCIVLDLKPDKDLCATSSISILADYFSATKKPDILFFSALWVGGANDPMWLPITVQKKVATYTNAYVIAANTTKGVGKGGGIYKPGGEPIVVDDSGKPMVLYAELPLKK